jgi:PAS domain S-box-containing protein
MEPRNEPGSLPDALLRQVVEGAPSAMVMVDREGRIVLVNAQAEKLFDYPRDELLGSGIETLVPARFRPRHPAYRGAFYEDPKSRPMGTGRELYALRKDGTEFPVEIGLNPVSTGDETFVIAAIVDITGRKRAEQELLAKTEELARLSANIQHVREEEKNRFARELHDDLGQLLVALKIEAGRIEDYVEGVETTPPVANMRNVYALIDQIVGSVRRIAADLRPTMLDDLGLIPAIDWLLDEFAANHHLRMGRHIDMGDFEFNHEGSTAVFRIVQEALTNVVRHSGATAVTLDISRQGQNCIVRVADNGRGSTSRARPAPNAFGLLGMRERAVRLGGDILIQSAPDQGFVLTLVLPLEVVSCTQWQDPLATQE